LLRLEPKRNPQGIPAAVQAWGSMLYDLHKWLSRYNLRVTVRQAFHRKERQQVLGKRCIFNDYRNRIKDQAWG